MQVVVLGAGAVGCYVGAAWSQAVSAAGGRLCLIGRASVIARLRAGGPKVEGLSTGALQVSTAASELAGADLVILSTKAHGLSAAMDEIAAHAPAKAPLLSLLNGLAPVRALRSRFPDRPVIAGMVPFNVVWSGADKLHKSGQGQIALERGAASTWLQHIGCPVTLHADLGALQHGKLLLNLIGAVNALSGLPLFEMLQSRDYRRVYAGALTEAMCVFDRAGQSFAQVGPTHPRLAAKMLRAPNWIFGPLILRRQGLDPRTMTSLAVDLAAGRKTEVETLNGEVCRLGEMAQVPTPVNTALMRLVKAAEGKRPLDALPARALMSEAGL